MSQGVAYAGIRRHSLNLALQGDVSSSSRATKRALRQAVEPIKRLPLERHLSEDVLDPEEDRMPTSPQQRFSFSSEGRDVVSAPTYVNLSTPTTDNVLSSPDVSALEDEDSLALYPPITEATPTVAGEALNGDLDPLPSDSTLTALPGVLQMDRSRFVGRSPATQILAESLGVSEDTEDYGSEGGGGEVILAERVPSVSDIPRPSIVGSLVGSVVGSTVGSNRGSVFGSTRGAVVGSTRSSVVGSTRVSVAGSNKGSIVGSIPGGMEVSGMEVSGMDSLLDGVAPVHSSTPDVTLEAESPGVAPPTVYTEVERKGSKQPPDQAPIDTTPIYSKIIREKRPDDDEQRGLGVQDPQGSVSGGSSVRLSELTPYETEAVVDFIHRRVASRDQQPPPTPPRPPGQAAADEQLSVREVERSVPENDLNKDEPKAPKGSFLNKLKKSFKACSSDKKDPSDRSASIPQLDRPPSTFIGSEASIASSRSSLSLSQPKTLELLAANPEMCSQGSLSKLPAAQEGTTPDLRAVLSDPDMGRCSVGSGRSRSREPEQTPNKRRSRSKSLSRLIESIARRAKSLTEVSPMPGRSGGVRSPTQYENDTSLGITGSPVPPEITSPPPPRAPAPETADNLDNQKKRLSFVGKLKRKFSFGKTDKTKELSKSTPALNIPPDEPDAGIKIQNRSHSTDNLSSASSSAADLRTQIILRSPKMNKGCKCQVCRLVRQNIRSHYGPGGPPASDHSHKYEVVLKMRDIGPDFLSSECGSIASYQNVESYEVPDASGSPPGAGEQLATKTQSEIDGIVDGFKAEDTSSRSSSSSTSSLNTGNDVSEIRKSSASSLRQSAV